MIARRKINDTTSNQLRSCKFSLTDSRVVTALSTVPSTMAGMKIAFGQCDGGESAMNVAKGLGGGL